MRLVLWSTLLAVLFLVACSDRAEVHQDATVVAPGIAKDSTETPPATPTIAVPGNSPGVQSTGCHPPSSPVTAKMDGDTFTDQFDGAPPMPTPWCPPDWDIAVQSRDQETWDTLEPMEMQHGVDCSAPPATHHSDTYDAAVNQCKDHVMTGIFAGGYGAIYLTPNAVADFSRGQATVKFDVSTARTSERDWIDIWITPFQENLQLPLEDFLPDLQGPPRNAVQIRMDNSGSQSIFRADVFRDFKGSDVPGHEDVSYESLLMPSASVRTPFELDISRTHIRFGMPDKNFWWIDTDVPDIGFDAGVVQFGHHSYNPEKACDYNGSCGPNTWHWDNVSISPAKPFTMIHADQRFVAGDSSTKSINFTSPAPKDAYLRFAAIGTVEVSYDGGHSWQQAKRQAEGSRHQEHFSSYWTPIPAGTQSVSFRFSNDDWYSGPFRAKDFAIWSLAPPG